MQELIYTALVPHPPVLVSAVGGSESGRVRTTHAAMSLVAAELAEMNPDAVVILSPHGPVFQDAIAIVMLEQVGGTLGAFGAPDVALRASIDRDLGHLVIESARASGIPTVPVTSEWAEEWDAGDLDHGTLVPLLFLAEAGWVGPILPVAVGTLPPVHLYAFGQALQQAIDRSGRRIAVLASGDLSHRLSPQAPGGFSPVAAAFDREVVEALGRGNLLHLFDMDATWCERAGACALRPLMMLAGVLDGLQVQAQVRSYEGPFGVGYAVIVFRPGGPDRGRLHLPLLTARRRERVEMARASAHPAVVLARRALEHFIRTGLEIDFSAGAPHEGTLEWSLPDGLPEQSGLFVTLRIDGTLRGCIGSTEPTEPTLGLEIVRRVIQAGTEDPRFPPVGEEELPHLEYAIDLVGPRESCRPEDLNPIRFGVEVSRGADAGVLLPKVPGVESAQEQFTIACRKAGLDPDNPALEVHRFSVQHLQ